MALNGLLLAGRLVPVVAIALATLPAGASAPPEAPDASSTPAQAPLQLRLKGLLGLGSPYGFVGSELELAGRVFSLAAGLGVGARGAQFAGMVRARIQGSHGFLDAGLGGSGGAFSEDNLRICVIRNGGACEPAPVHTATWTNLEVGGGFQLQRFHLRGCMGAGILNNPGTFGEQRFILPYLALSMGVSLPL